MIKKTLFSVRKMSITSLPSPHITLKKRINRQSLTEKASPSSCKDEEFADGRTLFWEKEKNWPNPNKGASLKARHIHRESVLLGKQFQFREEGARTRHGREIIPTHIEIHFPPLAEVLDLVLQKKRKKTPLTSILKERKSHIKGPIQKLKKKNL